MKLTVVIVNYNVKYFLEQCIKSAEVAAAHVSTEIIVVDNASTDGSKEMMQNIFPHISYIYNTKNVGFSMANNQAMRIAKGEYILLLNPDTVVDEFTFQKTVQFMDDHPDAGGLGVKMVDGKGIFLPESKRGLPTPEVSFYKIFGFSKRFPQSKKFGQYHLGFLNDNETHQIDILAGAFMLMRKKALDKVGLLDEDFFMYGEDIDLSWRIVQGGYKNYYYPHTQIIHYKGESTKKGSLNYVFVFYNAMVIFAKKHFSKSNASLFSFFINLAIWLRAGASLTARFISHTMIPALDGFGIFALLTVFLKFYSEKTHIIYDSAITLPALTTVAIIIVLCNFLLGGYDKPFNLKTNLKANALAAASTLAIYALLPEELRFSRALILAAAIMPTFYTTGIRLALDLMAPTAFPLARKKKFNWAIVGDQDEAYRIKNLLENSGLPIDLCTFVAPHPNEWDHPEFVGSLDELKKLVTTFKINHIIFDNTALSTLQIIDLMQADYLKNIEFKIAPPQSDFIIGSNSINSKGSYYTSAEQFDITAAKNKRNKRLLDFFSSTVLLILSPILLLTQRNTKHFYSRLFSVWTGQKSWVGYNTKDEQTILLPKIKPAIFYPNEFEFSKNNISKTEKETNFYYAKNYKTGYDLKIILKNLQNIGQQKH